MTSSNEQDLARIGAASAVRVAISHDNCVTSADHIRASRHRIERSLDLLSTTTSRSHKNAIP